MNSLIIPVYRNRDTIVPLLEAIRGLQRSLGDKLEVVFVIDGSPDDSYELLHHELRRGDLEAQLVRLSRNFGSFAAIRVGLGAARGRYFAVMAADLQEPVELVQSFFGILAKEPVDVVIGQRSGRDDPLTGKLAAQLYWWLYRVLVVPVPPGGVDVFGCNAAVRDALLRFEESNTSLVGLLFWLGFRRQTVPYQRLPRGGSGKSAWTFRKKLRYMIDSVFAFTDLPITLITAVGILGMGLSLVVSITVLAAWLAGTIQVSGYTPIMLMLGFSTSVNLLSIGVLGSYLWRTYENTKRRPLAVPMTRETFAREEAP